MKKEDLQSFNREIKKLNMDRHTVKDMGLGAGTFAGVSVIKDLYGKSFKKIPMTGYKLRAIENAVTGAITLGILGTLRKKFNPAKDNRNFNM